MLQKTLLSIVIGTAIATSALAGEADVRKAVEAKLSGAKVESVTKSGYLGLYEIYVDGRILYTDEKVSALFAGNIFDTKTMKNVTEERMNKLTAIKFSDLPLERAIKIVRGDGKRIIATFEDPNCGFCKKLAKELQKVDNVTIYTFLYPILSEDSVKKSRQIWCASDRAKAWNDWMVDGKAPSGREDCDVSAIAKNQEFGHRLNVSGTPTMFFTDGERVPGYLPAANLDQRLNQSK